MPQPDMRRVELALRAEAQARAKLMKTFQKSTTTATPAHSPPPEQTQTDSERIGDVVDDLIKATATKAGFEAPASEDPVDLDTVWDDDPNVDNSLRPLGKTQVRRELK